MARRKTLAFLGTMGFALCAALAPPALGVQEPDVPSWVDATGDLGGGNWGGKGIWTLAAHPSRDEVIANIVARGLWGSTDGGATWKRMGAPGRRPPDAGNAVRYIFDPRDPNRFWASGMYGFGIWRTDDGGKTFTQLGNLTHVDGLGVDLTDPARRTLVTCLHEQERSVHCSTDGGRTWKRIGNSIPENANFTSDPIAIDSKTFITNTAGWRPGKSWGIRRTADGGKTWAKVSDLGAGGSPLVASDGTIYWQALWDMVLIRSDDKGKTWRKLGGPVRGGLAGPVAEGPGGRLIGAGGTKLYSSADRGATWHPFGPAVPFKPRGVVYSAKRRSVYVWRETKGRTPNAIVRYDLPRDPDEAFADVKAGVLVAWDGDGFASGGGWTSPGGSTFLKPQTGESHGGKTALQFHVEAGTFLAGWNWHNWALGGLTDITGYDDFAFWVKFAGRRKPGTFVVELNCGPAKISSKGADVLRYCPKALDGKWHEVVIPLADLYSKGDKYDPKSTYELRVLTTAKAGAKFDIYVDDIRFVIRGSGAKGKGKGR